jgi:hypothetical protein
VAARLAPDDLAELAAAGIPRAEAERQLALLAAPPPPAALVRPCTVGDGVERLAPARLERLAARGAAERDRGRVTKLVPASGAASRMFRALVAARARWPGAGRDELAARPEPEARDAAAFADALPRLALAAPLAAALGVGRDELLRRARAEPLEPLLAALLDPPPGLDALRLPKALLPFHAVPEGVRTPFVEHLAEGVELWRDRDGAARFHFTVPPGDEPLFAAELGRARDRFAPARLEVAFSEQSGATDTLALDARGEAARTPEGRLLLRPSGHGALLDNLQATAADLVVLRNIDNVLPQARRKGHAPWRLALVGLLAELADSGRADPRPLRVAAVVRSTGEPGGGPFWVRGRDGAVTPQIVEASQVDLADPVQKGIWEASTHFNPVDLGVALRDRRGRPHELARFVDPAASFVTTKSEAGRDLRVLERPGLWNGAMAGWETVFVEVPGDTFAPVKTVLDLARPEHAR